MEANELLNVKIVGLSSDLVSLPKKIGNGSQRTCLMIDSALLLGLHADVGAPTLALRVDTDLLCLFVIDACHMLHG